ncbi:MAG: hypothetical protein HC904_14870 [Blastochloris sp.]|nr:hypothetical protein [Blastochloris sp.]
MVLRFEKAGRAVVLAGDISEEVEKVLLGSGQNLKADLLLQGEHSRERNLSREWLGAVQPRWLVRPQRGYHPDRMMEAGKMRELKELGIELLRMDETGALQFRIGQGGEADITSWSSERGAFVQ